MVILYIVTLVLSLQHFMLILIHNSKCSDITMYHVLHWLFGYVIWVCDDKVYRPSTTGVLYRTCEQLM